MTLGAQPPLGAKTKPADANKRAWASSVAGISSTISTSKSWKGAAAAADCHVFFP